MANRRNALGVDRRSDQGGKVNEKIKEAMKLIVEAQRILDRVVRLVEPTATERVDAWIETFDPKDPRTMEIHAIGSRLGAIRSTYFKEIAVSAKAQGGK
jgi:hypothetical protein